LKIIGENGASDAKRCNLFIKNIHNIALNKIDLIFDQSTSKS
jgi:hypothetical protein